MKDPILEAAAQLQAAAQPDEDITPDNALVEGEEVEEEDAVEAEEESEDQPLPSIEPPASWSSAQKESWDGLTPEAQEVISDREKQRDSYLFQKSNDLAAQQKESERLATETRETRDRYLAQLEKPLEGPSLDLLNPQSDNYSPDEYLRQKAVFEEQGSSRKTALAEAKVEAKQDEDRQYEAFNSQRASDLQREWPELLDPATGQQTWQNLAEYGATRGIGPEQLRMAAAQELVILEESRQYRLLKAEAPKTAKKLKSVRPGSAGKKEPIKKGDMRKAMDSFAKNPVGNRAAAVAMLKGLNDGTTI